MRAANFIFGKIFSLGLLCCENFLIGYNFSMQACAISPSAHKFLLIRIFAVLYFYIKKCSELSFFPKYFFNTGIPPYSFS